ncbi:MAG: hypothetical protein ACREOH_05480, partial [Candidatus Entotheonellia bacterium]
MPHLEDSNRARIEAGQGISDSMALLLRAYDAFEEGILVVSPQGQICYYNQAYARLRHIAPPA